MLRHPAAFILDGCYFVDSMAGDEGQLVRTLPHRWLESHTVTAEPAGTTGFFTFKPSGDSMRRVSTAFLGVNGQSNFPHGNPTSHDGLLSHSLNPIARY
jgi:hypothetical protein